MYRLIKNELPHETFLELATWYYQLDQNNDAFAVLNLAPQIPEIIYWQAFLKRKTTEEKLYFKKPGKHRLFFRFRFVLKLYLSSSGLFRKIVDGNLNTTWV